MYKYNNGYYYVLYLNLYESCRKKGSTIKKRQNYYLTKFLNLRALTHKRVKDIAYISLDTTKRCKCKTADVLCNSKYHNSNTRQNKYLNV